MNATIPTLVIGAGPAGLWAAEILCAAGLPVMICDSMTTPARKFLRAGIGGLNLTHGEPLPGFAARYGAQQERFARLLAQDGPEQLRAWAADLGIETFVGSSGRVFPTGMKAAPLLRAWLRRLTAQGAHLHTRHRWRGWDESGALRFATPQGEQSIRAEITILALGGASWPQLGSDGGWAPLLQSRGVAITPLAPANCGFDVAFSEHFSSRFAGSPVKAVGLSFGEKRLKGEFVITAAGIEGSAVYALSAPLRDALAAEGRAILSVDLKPDWSHAKLAQSLSRPRGSRSFSNHLERCAAIHGVAAALLRERLGPDLPQEPQALAQAIKSLPLPLLRPRPLAEAISTAGGVSFDAVDDSLMLKALPGTFVAGEMLDWEAPTGGYLLTGCFATGRAAGRGAAAFRGLCPHPPGAAGSLDLG